MSTSIIIFGASGDLSQRKLIPGLFNLYRKGRLPADFRIVGFATRPWGDGDFRAAARAGADQFADFQFADADWAAFVSHLAYRSGDFTDPAAFAQLAAALATAAAGPADRLFYLATPPRFYADIVANLGQAGLVKGDEGWRRVIIEKPFGHDEPSARALNQAIHRVLDERQIYRIDHYLGKETVQNILVTRFANTIYEPLWNRTYVDHVQITVAETVGVGSRAGYYDGVGAVRDMFQNHIMQLLSLVAMEAPASFDAEALREEKVKVLKAVRPIREEEVAANTVRAHYGGYRDEPGVALDSQTETYAAIRFFIDNWRWQGVPFYLRSGKRLAAKASEITIQFKQPPHLMFPLPADAEIPANTLTLCLQPDEGIHLRSQAKVPDTVADMHTVDLAFHYRDAFDANPIPEAYERLILDALHGDASLFTRGDRAELAWRLLDPILATWQANKAPLAGYEPGSWGPAASDELLARDGRAWLHGCAH